MYTIEELIGDIPIDIPDYARQCILVLQNQLAEYDYIGVKIAMGVATKEEYAEIIAYTETLRKKIRDLEHPTEENNQTPDSGEGTE